MRGRARIAVLGLAVGAVALGGCAGGGVDRPEAPRRERFSQRGKASWYGSQFQGRPTASGEVFDVHRVSAAHRTLPFGTVVRVRNLDNGREVEVRINDRGPFVRGRVLDLSRAAAEDLDMLVSGVAEVRLWVVAWPDAAPPPQPTRTVATTLAADPGGGWVVQAGAFRDHERATRLAARLRRTDPRAGVHSSDGWHRVQVPGLDAGEARALVERLAARGIESVVLPPG
ncbi:MAG TPA: septal ring lytic transglycosylase RlpA family protein [Thermoanaerobaculia bacterium]|nr:septal ring lytic transglycosylase RlpA family protein [Thermoanaerobaculia bacterium]